MGKPFRWHLKQSEPEAVGMCSQRLKRLTQHLQSYVDQNVVAGLIAVVARKDQIVHAQQAGMLDIESGTPMPFDALFRIFSMTKIITSVATLMLYEEGAFLLDDPVSHYLPEFKKLQVREVGPDGKAMLAPPKRPITIHHLLTHTSGLSYDGLFEANARGLNLEKWLPEFCERPLLGHPGEVWRYGANVDVLGRLIEVISGQPLDEFLKRRIFEPLGMADTDFWVPPEKRARLASLYGPDAAGKLVRLDPVNGESPYFKQQPFLSGGGGLLSQNPEKPQFAGGLAASTGDYLQFAQMLLHGGAWNSARILSPHSVRLMTRDHLPAGHPPIEVNKRRFGYGVSILLNPAETQMIGSLGEFGWGGAVCTQVWIDPREQMVSLVMVQHRPAMGSPLGPLPLMRKFKVLAYQAILDSNA